MLTFSQLSPGDEIHVLEVTGTFKKTTTYSVGRINNISPAYEEQLPAQQFPMPNQIKRRLVDITISCDGEQKKLSVEEGKGIITDTVIGLTVSTDKQQIVNIIRNQYNDYKAKKDAIAKFDEEMKKCQDLLDKLDIPMPPKEDPKIKELQDEINELKGMIKQAGQMVPQPMKQMLPQNMQNVLNEVGQ